MKKRILQSIILCAMFSTGVVWQSGTLHPTPGRGEFYQLLGTQSANKQWKSLEATAREALGVFGKERGFRSYLVWALREQNKLNEALSAARSYAADDAADTNIKKHLLYTLVALGQEGLVQKKANAAGAHFLEALTIDSSRAYVHVLLGRALLESGQTEAALNHLEKSRRQFPDNQGLRYRLSLSLAAAHKDARAKPLPERNITLRALSERSAKQIVRGQPLYENRWFFKRAAECLLDLGDAGAMDDFFAWQIAAHADDSYVHHLVAGFLRRVYNKNPKDNKAYYDRAVAARHQAIRLYEKQYPNRPALGNLRLPLTGMVFVIGASETTYTHLGYNKYCYDFLNTDATGALLRAETDGSKVENYVGFGETIRAARAGKVISVDNDFIDLPIGVMRPADNNEVRLEHEDGITSVYMHNRQGSARVREGQSVPSGQALARVGNSGWTLSPHLHFCFYDKRGVSLPLRFEGVEVRRPGRTDWEQHAGPYEKGWLLRAR